MEKYKCKNRKVIGANVNYDKSRIDMHTIAVSKNVFPSGNTLQDVKIHFVQSVADKTVTFKRDDNSSFQVRTLTVTDKDGVETEIDLFLGDS